MLILKTQPEFKSQNPCGRRTDLHRVLWYIQTHTTHTLNSHIFKVSQKQEERA